MNHRYCIRTCFPAVHMSQSTLHQSSTAKQQLTIKYCRKIQILQQLKTSYQFSSSCLSQPWTWECPFSTHNPADLISDHRAPQPPRRIHNALQSQGSSQANLWENRRAPRSQWSSCSCHILRPGQGITRRYRKAGRSASHPPTAFGGTTQRLPRSWSLRRNAAQGTPYLPTVWDCAELRLCLQGGSQWKVWGWDYECYLVFDQGWEGDWWGW